MCGAGVRFLTHLGQKRRRLAALVESIKRFIESDEMFARIASCKAEYWAAMTDVAVQRLRPWMPLRPLGQGPLGLRADVTTYLWRTGYVPRRIDEALCEEPRSPDQLNLDVSGELRRARRRSGRRRKKKRFGRASRASTGLWRLPFDRQLRSRRFVRSPPSTGHWSGRAPLRPAGRCGLRKSNCRKSSRTTVTPTITRCAVATGFRAVLGGSPGAEPRKMDERACRYLVADRFESR